MKIAKSARQLFIRDKWSLNKCSSAGGTGGGEASKNLVGVGRDGRDERESDGGSKTGVNWKVRAEAGVGRR